MSNDLEFVEVLVGEVLGLLAPLEQSVSSLDAFDATLLEHGWVPPTGSDYLNALQDVLGQLVDIQAVADAFQDFVVKPGVDTASGAFDAIGKALGNLQTPTLTGIASALPAPLNSDEFWGSFLRELGDKLFIEWLRRRLPQAFALLHLTGIVDIRQVDPGQPSRLPYRRYAVVWESLGDAIINPDKLMQTTYGWGTSFDAPLFLDRMTAAMVALGVRATTGPAANALRDRFWGAAIPADGNTPRALQAVEVPLVREGRPGEPLSLDLSLDLVPVPATGATGKTPWVGLALVPVFEGSSELSFALSAAFRLEIGAGLSGLTGPAIELRPNRPPELTMTGTPPNVALTAAVLARPDIPFLLVGSRTSHRVELDGFSFGVEMRDPLGSTPELIIAGTFQGLTITIQLKDGDGFLNKIFGTKPQTLTADTKIIWSSRTGLAFEGQAALKLILPINRPLGPVELQQIILELSVTTDSTIKISGAVTAKTTLGPVSGTVEEVGVALTLKPGDKSPAIGAMGMSWGFLPPKGLSLRIAGGPVTGGGYLFCDPDAGQYAGALELSFKALNLKAIGLLNTRLPDGKPGFSLLIIITVEFTPIQLGFGFTLNGVGGLLGINRTMNVDALRAGVRQRTLDAILFPKDPAANAPQLIASLKQVFPPSEGRYIFGPMVKIGWGPTSLLEIEAALILELPSPLRLAVLGRISAVLPDRKSPIISLRLDIAGVVDFDRGEISVDATLVDSFLAMFALTGDMALRIGWKANKSFALSAGGFNPRFTPPPAFPSLDRLAITLAQTDNPRLRLESYFALTANTVQFGARVDFFAKADTFVGTFSAAAYAGFDAMVQFQPFGFVADLCMGIELAHNGEPFLSAVLRATIEGPRPWHVAGEVEFSFFGKRRIAVDVTIGEVERPQPLEIKLGPEIAKALEAPDAWTAELPDAAGQLVTLRSGTPGSAPLVHPLGSITVRQRLLPLETTLEKFGQAVPAPFTPRRFTITSTALRVGGTEISRSEGAALVANYDDFAPGQFLDLTDDQKLARPAFESMPSGVRVGTTARRWPTIGEAAAPAGVAADLGYDIEILDAPSLPVSSVPGMTGTPHLDRGMGPVVLEDWLLARLVPGGAAAESPRRVDVNRHEGTDQRITIRPERYVVAAKRNLKPTSGTPASRAQTSQQVRDPDVQQVITTAELAP